MTLAFIIFSHQIILPYTEKNDDDDDDEKKTYKNFDQYGKKVTLLNEILFGGW